MPRHTSFGSLFLLCLPVAATATTTVAPDGNTAPYALIESRLGARNVEVPDCSHPDFGPHITQDWDATLAAWTFLFHLHVSPDNDRCLATDRQRNEIKVSDTSPAALKIYSGDGVYYRWRFRLDAGFQASTAFTHLHQVRPYDGDAVIPVLMLTARQHDVPMLELNHQDSKGQARTLATVPLQPLLGEWVEASSRLQAGTRGQYRLTLTRVSDGATLFSYQSNNLDLWRSGTTFLRPKWGLYRSLAQPAALRDEVLKLASICLDKDDNGCGPDVAVALTRSAASASVNEDKADNTLDGRLLTRWEASGDGQWIQYDLGTVRTPTELTLAWYQGSSRHYRFDVQLSDDGVSFTTLYSGESSGVTSRREPYALPAASGRYLRIVGHGNSTDSRIAITEMLLRALP